MEWHDVQNPDDKLLDELAARYSLHPLHVEDCRQDAQRTKAETGEGYLFISLKQMAFDDSGRLATGDLVLFVGGDFLLTVHRAPVALLEPLRAAKGELRPDQVLYRVMDAFVESYIPLVERLESSIERLEDVVVGAPRPTVLENIGEARSTLLELRRVLNATRHVVVQLRHVPATGGHRPSSTWQPAGLANLPDSVRRSARLRERIQHLQVQPFDPPERPLGPPHEDYRGVALLKAG